MEPTVYTGVTNDMRIVREEIFGPVLVVISFDTEEEAVELANDPDYGLVGGVFTSDMSRRLANLSSWGTFSSSVRMVMHVRLGYAGWP